MTTFDDCIKLHIDRSTKIMKFLFDGPATLDHLHQQLFIKDDGSTVSLPIAKRRLDRLCEMKYLKFKRYERVRGYKGLLVYALDELGANDTTILYNLNRDQVRMQFPHEQLLTHEILISDFIRTIHREVDDNKYALKDLYDDKELRLQWHDQQLKLKQAGNYVKGQKRKPLYFPDIRLIVQPNFKAVITFNIELDAGVRGPRYWKPKIASWHDVTLILTLNTKRMNQQIQYVSDSGRQQATGFAIANDFIKNGLAGTEFIWLPYKNKGKLML